MTRTATITTDLTDIAALRQALLDAPDTETASQIAGQIFTALAPRIYGVWGPRAAVARLAIDADDAAGIAALAIWEALSDLGDRPERLAKIDSLEGYLCQIGLNAVAAKTDYFGLVGSTHLRRRQTAIRAAREALLMQGIQDADDDLVAEEVNVTRRAKDGRVTAGDVREGALTVDSIDAQTVELVSTLGRPESIDDADQVSYVIQRALTSLTPNHRRAFLLSELDGLSSEAIAASWPTPISERTIRNWLVTARRLLAEAGKAMVADGSAFGLAA